MIHRIARAYGKFPHEVEALTPYQLTMASICLDQADRDGVRSINETGAMSVYVVGGLGGR